LLVTVPCRYRSGVPAESQISMPTTVVQVPVADQLTELLLLTAAGLAAENVVNVGLAHSVDPRAVYPLADSSVPLAPFVLPLPEPIAVISRSLNGVVAAVGATPELLYQ
jgi:hypothetical protein